MPENAIKLTKAPQAVPPGADERRRIRRLAAEFAAAGRLVPPLSLEELEHQAGAFCRANSISCSHHDYASVMINNEVWRGTVASVPFERRILLIPQCLRNAAACPATMDELGLLCMKCGKCDIGRIQSAAEKLGYVVLVAEGTTVVTKLLEGGKIDSVIGIGCMSVLEKAFSQMTVHAIPGIAVPLNKDGCIRSEVDTDWVLELIAERSEGRCPGQVDLDGLRADMSSLFQRGPMEMVTGPLESEPERIAFDYLLKSGKRWRPALLAGIYRALNGSDGGLPAEVKKLAVAVECFHKASLIHDDIEDGDEFRDEDATLHKRFGVPVALNTGDLLIGKGYHLISSCGLPGERKLKMLAVAAEGHRNLCLGQGEELLWSMNPVPASPAKAIEIFRNKTSPAFEVALSLGAISAGADDGLCRLISKFSVSLGIAYQIRDDLNEYLPDAASVSNPAFKASIIASLAYDNSDSRSRAAMKCFFNGTDKAKPDEVIRTVADSHAVEKATQLCEFHRNEAVRSLNPIQNSSLKSFLRRIIGRMI